MKSLYIFLLTLACSFHVQSQKTQSLEGMSAPEIRKHLLTQTNSAEAKEMIMKHNRSRKTAYGFLGATLILGIISSNSTNPDQDNKDSILAAVGAVSSGVIALACGISAGERMKKAKEIYLNNGKAQAYINYKPFIRSEFEIQKLGGY